MNNYNGTYTYTLNPYEGCVHWGIKAQLTRSLVQLSSLGSSGPEQTAFLGSNKSAEESLEDTLTYVDWMRRNGSGLRRLDWRGEAEWLDFSILDAAPVSVGDEAWMERVTKKDSMMQPDVSSKGYGGGGLKNIYEVIDSNYPSFKKLLQFVESNVNVVLIHARTRTYELQQGMPPSLSAYNRGTYNFYWEHLTEASMGWRGTLPRWQKMLIAYLFRTQLKEERALRVTYSKRKKEFYFYTEYNMDIKPHCDPFKLADVERLKEKTDNFTKFNKGIDNKQAMIMYILPALLEAHEGKDFEHHLPSWSQFKQRIAHIRQQELINRIYSLKGIEKDIPQPDQFLNQVQQRGGVDSFFKNSRKEK